MFLVFDGIDGAGKTTQLARLADRLRNMGRTVVTLRDPGGTPAGEAVRAILLERRDVPLHLRAEVLLVLAARAQSVEQVIRPALARGDVVLSDRYVPATWAYQGRGGGFDPDRLMTLAEIAIDGVRPDLTLIFDMDAAAARARRSAARGPAADDRIEARSPDYHARVAEGFREWLRREPDRTVRIDAAGPPDEVEAGVWAAVRRVVGVGP